MEDPVSLLVTKKNFEVALEQAIGTLNEEVQKGMIGGGKVTGRMVNLRKPKNLVVVGDLHGDLESLQHVLTEINFESFLSDPQNKMIFLGDYVDRGSHSVEVLQAICLLKHRYPDSVILMRGNHEAPSEFPFPSHDLPARMLERLGNEGELLYHKVLEFFRLLTLTTIIEGSLLLVHGGPPVEVDGACEKLMAGTEESPCENNALEEVLWNDPRPLDVGIRYEESRRMHGKHFGEDLSKIWLSKTGTKAIVRSHEPCMMSRLDHNNKVMTIFSCGESYPNFEPGYLRITEEDLGRIQDAHDLSQYVRKIKRRG